MSEYTFRQLQQLCVEHKLLPARGKGVTKKVLYERLFKADIIGKGKEKVGKKDKIMQDCVLCISSLEGNIITTECKHVFHLSCISKMRNDVCPLCRDPLKWKGCAKILNHIRKRKKEDVEVRRRERIRAGEREAGRLQRVFDSENSRRYRNGTRTNSNIAQTSQRLLLSNSNLEIHALSLNRMLMIHTVINDPTMEEEDRHVILHILVNNN